MPPPQARPQPKSSSKGCLLTVLVMGGIGLATCFTSFLLVWKNPEFQRAVVENQAAEQYREHPHEDTVPYPGDAPDPHDLPAIPVGEMFAPGCYAIELEFESFRDENGQYEDWEVSDERSRSAVPCDTVRAKAPNSEEQELLANWPPEAKVLRVQILSSTSPTSKDPFTRRKVARIHALIEGAQ